MQLIKHFRTLLQDSILQSEHPSFPCHRCTVSMEEAKSIGILFDGTQREDQTFVIALSEKLIKEGKKVKALAFLNNKATIEDFSLQYFNRNDLDFALRPKGHVVDEFIRNPFDLLLNISNREVVPLDFIAAHSKAKFRVGPFTGRYACYDLMIEDPDKKDIISFLDQITIYMKKLQPNHESTLV